MKSSKVQIRKTAKKMWSVISQKYNAVFVMLVLVVCLSWHAAAQKKAIKLRKSEKIKVIKNLLDVQNPVATEFPGKGKGIFVSFYNVPADIIALFPKRIKSEKVIVLTLQDIEKKEGTKWAYYTIGPIYFYENRLVASIGSNAYCSDDARTFAFYRESGSLKSRKLGFTVGECLTRENDNKAEDEETYPIIKTEKPNE